MRYAKKWFAFFLAAVLCVLSPLHTVMAVSESSDTAYVIDEETMLALGDNTLTLSTDASTTIWEFCPAESGIYRFTASSEDALVGYWGGHSPFVMDYTEDKSNTLECSVETVGPSIMVGISGVESVVLTVTRVGDVPFVRQTFTEYYDYTHRFKTYRLPVGASLVDMDGPAYLGTDGFYHYGSESGPLVVIDFSDVPMDLGEIASLGQMNVAVLAEDGHVYKTDYSDAMLAYVEQKLYPVTEELAAMIQAVSDNKGWVTDGWLQTDDPDNAWLAFCHRVKGADVKWQLNADAAYDSPTADLRLISWVDSLNYSKVSFFVTLAGQTVELSSDTVYTAINAGSTVIEDAGSVFEKNALYFVTYTITGLPSAYYDTEITAYVVWTDLNGVETVSAERTIYVSDAM